jgi:hypothetical protein
MGACGRAGMNPNSAKKANVTEPGAAPKRRPLSNDTSARRWTRTSAQRLNTAPPITATPNRPRVPVLVHPLRELDDRRHQGRQGCDGGDRPHRIHRRQW